MNLKLSYLLICLLLLSLSLTACGSAETKASANIITGNAATGEKLFTERGCVACHAVDADQVKIGPSLVGVASRSPQTITQADYTGQAKTVEAYLFESITQPQVYTVKEYSPIMPKIYGADLTEQELADLISYLLTLK